METLPPDTHPAQASIHGNVAWMTPIPTQNITKEKNKETKNTTEVTHMASDGSVKYQKGTFGYI